MGAKNKLNAAALNGALVVGGLVGAVTGSWTAFFLCAAVLVASAVHAGDIRAGRRQR